MKNKVFDYIDLQEVNKLLEGFNRSTGFVTAILDLDGNVLSQSGWRSICTTFHRKHPETTNNCKISDTILANQMGLGEKYHFYHCLNGLVDVAVPIVIKGEHVANLFSGQFFFEEPDRDRFEKQAQKYGFDQEEYMKALDKVPVVSKEKVKSVLDFLLDMTQLISEISFQKIEQAKLYDALKASEMRSRNILDNMLEGCQLIGFDWKYIYINHTAEAHNHLSASNMVGNSMMDVWPGIEHTEVYQRIKHTLEDRVTEQLETEWTYPDGSMSIYDLSIQPVPEGIFILSIDISERKKIEKALQYSEDRFRKAFDTNPDAITITRLSDGVYVSANNGFNLIFGYEPNEVVGKTSLGINMWHKPEDRIQFVNALFKNGLVENFEATLQTKSGKRIDALVSASNIELDGVDHVLSTTKDITKLKKIQKSLESSQEKVRKLNDELEKRVEMRTAQLEAANKELEAFTYSVSHDLRAPLRHISGYVDLLNNRFKNDLPDKAQHYLANISASSTQMGTLIDDLLQFSRTGRQEVHQTTFDMKALFEDVFHKMNPDLKGRNISWNIQQMPEVVGDYALLKQVWINLLDNAVKYTRKQDHARVDIECQENDKEHVFLIRDNGVGFDMRYADKLFGVFQRLHAQTEFEGTGIGLANVKRIVQKHQGKVWADAELGKGATFYFSLPKINQSI